MSATSDAAPATRAPTRPLGSPDDRKRIDVDVCVVGAGAAGLYASLCAAREGARVALLSAMPLAQTASYWAQGGLAAALAADDTPKLHLADSERAGRGAVRHSAAQTLVAEAPACVHDLQQLGFHFDADRRGRLALGLEGGHSVRRIVHAGGSATGRRLLRELSALVVAHERVRVIEGARMSALLLAEPGGRCVGLDCAANGGRPEQRSVAVRAHARATILSTGGAAALWARTTNPPGSVGQGLLLAHGAGAELADLEFVQFHPTAVIGVAGREGFLITEAIRGEGAVLLDPEGERFVDELAPRDEVSRAIQRRLQRSGARSVSLDMRAIDPALFPNVVGALREAGLDPTREPIPVAPAAHYTIGGVVTDLHGHTAVAGLYAVGETACTGLHGANRLASNSLSECFVFGRRAALAALDEPPAGPSAAAVAGAHAIEPVTRATREALSARAGIERDAEGLSGLLADPHPLARMLARSALERRETRGTHARSDHPEPDPALDGRHAVLAGASDRLSWQSWR
ncbi:MAG TPA: FAD-dependent oxidoreductase [Solirubrobacteraceae bacterium]|nr:FAD-dependent oxidoreductase [Solirubrobacteraceae bacterium]